MGLIGRPGDAAVQAAIPDAVAPGEIPAVVPDAIPAAARDSTAVAGPPAVAGPVAA